MNDLFAFWEECGPADRVHPRDKPVFDRTFLGDMGFDLRCLPACFAGRLRTAPVVLLDLSPGWRQADVDEAGDPKAQARYADRRKGDRPLDSEAEHPHHYAWWSSRTKLYGPPEIVREKVAVLNLGAYHSHSFDAHHGLAALPSCRVALDWAHEVLFPQAMAGERVVICMRAAENWGLKSGRMYEGSLFAPQTVRGGHIRRGEHEDIRQRIVDAVRGAIGVGDP